MRRFGGLSILAAACGGLGCSGTVTVADVATTDSAGISIVVSMTSAGEGEIIVDSTPSLRVGETEGEELFRVADAAQLPDGTLVVLDGGSREVRWFDPNGAMVLATGGRGEGPGEFDRFASVSPFRGDSVLVFDNWLRRATIYDGRGSLGRVISLPPEMQAEDLVPFGNDRLLALTWSLNSFMDLEGPYRLPYMVLLLSTDGAVEDTVVSLPGPGGYKVLRAEGNYTDFAPLIIENGYLASHDGEAVYGGADRWEIRRTDTDGALRQIIRVPSLDRPLTATEVERERAAMLRPESSAEYRSLVSQLEPPSQWPGYGDLLVAADGWIWAAEYRSLRTEADAPTRWLVFDGSGAWVGVATTPPRFRVFEVGAGFVLGVRRDDLDIEYVERLEWTARAPI
jgi:hypothetical protein